MNAIAKFAAVISFGLAISPTWADETLPEKAKVIKNDASRATKKAVHRVEEAVCAKSDAVCLAKKAKNRAAEAGDAVGDQVSKTKNKID